MGRGLMLLAAPYERTMYGGVTHTVTATVPGLGRFGADLVASTIVEIVGLSKGPDGLPSGLDINVQAFNECLGPYVRSSDNFKLTLQSIDLRSDLLTVGGIIDCKLDLPSPPAEALIRSLGVSILQSIVVELPSGEVVTPPPQTRILLRQDSVSKFAAQAAEPDVPGKGKRRDTSHERRRFIKLAPDAPWSFSQVIRVPSDDVRPAMRIAADHDSTCARQRCPARSRRFASRIRSASSSSTRAEARSGF